MYERTQADYDRLLAEGFEEMDAHWFVHPSEWSIHMPSCPYYQPEDDQDWELYEPEVVELGRSLYVALSEPVRYEKRNTLTAILELFHSKIKTNNQPT